MVGSGPVTTILTTSSWLLSFGAADASAHVPRLIERLRPIELRITGTCRPARIGAEIALVLRQARRLPANVAGDAHPARAVVIVEAAVGHEHTEDGDVTRLEVGDQEPRATLFREAHRIRAEI